MDEDRNTFNILTGKHTGKRTLGRARRRWVENIRMFLKEICTILGTGLTRFKIRIIGEGLL